MEAHKCILLQNVLLRCVPPIHFIMCTARSLKPYYYWFFFIIIITIIFKFKTEFD